MEKKVCILYGKNHYTALRLGEILKNNGFEFLYCKNLLALKEHIASVQDNLLCIFVELENNNESIELISEAKTSTNSDSIYLIALSEEPRRIFFVRAIIAGATDFIVKPFEESLLLGRLSNAKKSLSNDSYSFNLQVSSLEMLRIELIKSKKGNYPLSFGLITFFKPVIKYNAKLEQQYRKDLPEVFSELGKSLFETDNKQLLGSQSMLVSLTFCNKEKISLVENKVLKLFQKLKIQHPSINDYLMAQVFIPGYEDVFEPVDILNTMMSMMDKAIVEQKEGLKLFD
ncbi:MAG TPA: hypothetical protein VIK78_06425 [Ruminiclostridium sp.]